MTLPAQRGAPAAAVPGISTPEQAVALCSAIARSAALLTDLIDRETELVANGQAAAIEELQGDKAELSAAYLRQMIQLKQNADAVRGYAHDEMSALKPRLQELGAKLVRNQTALAAILSVSERLLRAAALRVISSDTGPKTYGRDGHVARPPAANPATAVDRQY